MPSEKSILTALADNEALMTAAKELILSHFDEAPFSEGASDELLGQISRARHVGRQRVEEAFSEIKSHKTIPTLKDKSNPAY